MEDISNTVAKKQTKLPVQKQLSHIVASMLDRLCFGQDMLEIDDTVSYEAVPYTGKTDITHSFDAEHMQVRAYTSTDKHTVSTYQEKLDAIQKIQSDIAHCTKCELSKGRTYTVPGEGVVEPLVMVIGEAPGADEDRSGSPFVGKAGKYLDKWLEAIQLSRKTNAFIANIVKCRPPKNRDPQEQECIACSSFLHKQLAILQPKAIFCVGRIATQFLSKQWGKSMASLRMQHLSYNSIPMIATYHPSAVLRNPDYRRPVWLDLQKLQKILNEVAGS